jgi:hypothetical protein
MDEKSRWENSYESLENLGPFEDYWESTQKQIGFQGGQFFNAQYNHTWIKTPGISLKQIQLSLPDDLLFPFLQSPWGLQVSFCTSVARRVPLRELIGDVMPALVESLFPIPPQWESLKVDHKILDAFQRSDLQEWLGNLGSELRVLVVRIIRYILLVLKDTGIGKKGEYFVIAWIQRAKPFQCFKVPCKRESHWARILADSVDCATFAYVTSRCLETGGLKCRGPTAMWLNRSALLETAVCRHKQSEEQPKSAAMPWALKHADLYSMGKPDSLLWVRVDRPSSNENARLHVMWSMIPPEFLFRLDVKRLPKRLQRIRERQAIDAPAENVVVVSK